MNNRIYNRVIDEAKYIIINDKTVRDASLVFGVSKSTVHNDMRYRLSLIDKNLYEKVSSIMGFHADIREESRQKESFWREKCNICIKNC